MDSRSINDHLRRVSQKGSVYDQAKTISNLFSWVRELVSEIEEEQKVLSEKYSTQNTLRSLRKNKGSDEENENERQEVLKMENEKMELIKRIEYNMEKKIAMLNKLEQEARTLLSEINRLKH